VSVSLRGTFSRGFLGRLGGCVRHDWFGQAVDKKYNFKNYLSRKAFVIFVLAVRLDGAILQSSWLMLAGVGGHAFELYAASVR